MSAAPVATTTVVAITTVLRFVIRAPHRTALHTDLMGGGGASLEGNDVVHPSPACRERNVASSSGENLEA
jgi:hypothetical protein